MSHASPRPPRVIGLDIIRSLAFLAIIGFHGTWIFWPEAPSIPADWAEFPTPLWEAAFAYMRVGAFSGFTILLLTSFLFGLQGPGSRKRHWLLGYLVLGWVVFNVLLALHEGTAYQWVWDIYPLIGVGFYSVLPYLARPRSLRSDYICLALALAVLLTPFWRLQPWLASNPMWQEFLVGRCPIDYADWPLLPWVGLIWFGCMLGHLTRRLQLGTGVLQTFHRSEWLLWGALALGLSLSFDRYFHGRTSSGWACHTFRQPWDVFLPHLGAVLFCMRMSFHGRIQAFLQGQRWAQRIANLAINRHFYLAYLLHYLLLYLFAWAGQHTHAEADWFFDLALLGTIVFTEYGARLAARLFARLGASPFSNAKA